MSALLCGVLPLATVVALFAATIDDGSSAIDFRQFYWGADAIVRGDNPYPGEHDLLTASGQPYVYPPFPALLAAPFTALPLRVVELGLMAVLVGVVLATLAVLGVRDWRCYGVALLWPPVLSAVQTANVTLWFALASAVVWRYRERLYQSGPTLGLTLAIKFVLWPLGLWLAATRRVVAAILAALTAAALLLASWAVIGFVGMREYPDLLRRLEDTVGRDAYTLTNLALDLGASEPLARALWLTTGLGVLGAMVYLARHGDERGAFVLAIAAAIALSPLVWLHYFALLLVIVALTQPTLGIAWFVPLAMVVSPGRGNPTLLETFAALAAASVVIALSLRRLPDPAEHAGPEAVPVAATRPA